MKRVDVVKRVRAPVRIDFAGGTTDIEPFVSEYGGCVLNASINRYVNGELKATNKKVELKYSSNVPTSSGLGTSGAMNLVWLSLISNNKDKTKLAEGVYKLEQSMGLVGGKQDQYAAAFGGINFIEFGKNNKVKIHKLKLSNDLIKKLENNLVLVYSGKPHFSGNFNKAMIDNLKKGKTTKNFIEIKNIARKMKNSLLKEDLDSFAQLMNEESEQRAQLHPSILGTEIKNIIKQGFENGATSAKICGSGGGGSVLFFTYDRKRLVNRFKDKIIDFKFDFDGLRYL